MRLAYICMDPGVPVPGNKGASVHVQEIIRAFLRRGVQVELVVVRSGDMPSDLRSLRFHRLALPTANHTADRERAALRANDRLQELLMRAGPFDCVYERFSLWSFAGMEHARASAIPGVLEINAPLIEEQAAHRELADRHAAEEAAARTFRAATALLAVSQEVARYLERYAETPNRIHVVPNAVDPARFPDALPASHPGARGTFTVGFVGSLKPWHDLSTLSDACARLYRENPLLRLLIVGDGPERARVIEDLSVRGLRQAAELTGAVDPADVPQLLASMDAAVAPYEDLPSFYFSPLKVYEYMAAGLPVVASRIGQIATLIEDGVTGLLYPPGDPTALAAALARLRADPDLRARLGQTARATVLVHHTWDARVRRILDVAGLGAIPASSLRR